MASSRHTYQSNLFAKDTTPRPEGKRGIMATSFGYSWRIKTAKELEPYVVRCLAPAMVGLFPSAAFIVISGSTLVQNVTGRTVRETRLRPLWLPEYPIDIWTTFGPEDIRIDPSLEHWMVEDVKRAARGIQAVEETKLLANFPDCDTSSPVLAFDTETYPGLDPRTPMSRVRMYSVSYKEGTAFVSSSVNHSQHALEDDSITKVGSNIKFDYHWLRVHTGIEMKNMIDTHVAAHVLDNSMPQKDLKTLSLWLTDMGDYSKHVERLRKERGNAWEKLKDDELFKYSGRDADASLRVWRGLEERLGSAGLLPGFRLLSRVYEALAGVEYNGLCVNQSENKRLSSAYVQEISKCRRRLVEHFGPVNFDSDEVMIGALKRALPGINLWDERAERISTDYGKVLSREYKSLGNPQELRDFIWYRKLAKIASTYISPFCTTNGFVHTSFNLDRVATYRLSSSHPNITNLPRNWGEGIKEYAGDVDLDSMNIKRQFVSRFPGGKLISMDESQIELRVLAHLCQDDNMLAAFREGRDIHGEVASKLFRKSANDVTENERITAKMVNFGTIYGISDSGLSWRLGVSETRAHKTIETFFEQFPSVRRFIDDRGQFCIENGYVEIPFGLRRVFGFPENWGSAQGRAILRAAFNAPIQGGAGIITQLALVECHNALKRNGLEACVVNIVHDDVWIDAPEEEVDMVVEICLPLMENPPMASFDKDGHAFSVPLKSKVKAAYTAADW